MRIRKAILTLPAVLLFTATGFAQGRGGGMSAGQPVQLATIRGRVADAETGAPILDARITLVAMAGGAQGGGSQSMMGSDFEYDNIPQGLYEIVVEAEGYQGIRQPFQINLGTPSYITIPMRKIKFVENSGKGKAVSSRLLQLPPSAREAYQSGMTQLYDKHDATKSLAFFEKTLKLAPSFYEANYQMGVAYQDLKRSPEAEAAFRDAARVSDGKCSPAEFSLASLFAERQNFAEAEAAARKGLESEPNSAQGHYEVARALLGQGKSNEAEAEAKASLELSRDLPQSYLLLAAVSANRGQPAEAVKALDQYLEAVPKGPLSDSVRALRENLRKQTPEAKEGSPAPSDPPKPR
jgi:Flp pilus assembly protein TadD